MSIDNPTAGLIFCHFQIELGFNIRGSSLIFKALRYRPTGRIRGAF